MVIPTLREGPVTLRPLAEEDVERLVPVCTEPGVAEWWGTPDSPEREAEGLRNDGRAWAVDVDAELAGWIGFGEENEPDYRYATLDIMLVPAFQDRGLGPRTLRLAIRWLIAARGHHRLTIDPARENERAIRAYASVGFRPVGVLRSYERFPDGTWHDGLLMDLLAGEAT